MDKNIAIEFDGVGKQYRLGRVGTGTLSHDLNRWWQTSILGKEDPYLKIGETNDRTTKGHSDYVWALKDISFKVEQGDVVGIIGKNGAGKSTLLKLLSHITAPSTGSIKYRGRIASLLEVGTGFHPEMTGRENIYMNGSIMGMTRHEITQKLDEIVDFAGVERYIDTPVKRYSSGMTVRLGFAVAAFLEPEILVVDEVLTVGDAEFQKKAIGKMGEVSSQGGRTVLFVSHNMGAVRNLCKHGIVLRNGCLAFEGSADASVAYYLSNASCTSDIINYKNEVSSAPIFVSQLTVCDEFNNMSNSFGTDEDIYLNINIVHKEKLPLTHLLVTILDANQNRITSYDVKLNGRTELILKIREHFLVRGNYSLMTHVYQPGIAPYEICDGICNFQVVNAHNDFAHLEAFNYGIVFPNISEVE